MDIKNDKLKSNAELIYDMSSPHLEPDNQEFFNKIINSKRLKTKQDILHSFTVVGVPTKMLHK